MKTFIQDSPRTFSVKGIEIKDWGKIELDAYDMVSFRTASGRECDFTATPWGYYLGPSLNSRLKREGFRSALVVNPSNQLYLMAVELDKLPQFHEYLVGQSSRIITWLDEWFG